MFLIVSFAATEVRNVARGWVADIDLVRRRTSFGGSLGLANTSLYPFSTYRASRLPAFLLRGRSELHAAPTRPDGARRAGSPPSRFPRRTTYFRHVISLHVLRWRPSIWLILMRRPTLIFGLYGYWDLRAIGISRFMGVVRGY